MPGLSLLQFPWRLLGPLALGLAVAVAGSFVPLLRSLEGSAGDAGRRAGWLLLGALTLAVALNGAGDRPLPLEDLDGEARRVDGTNVVWDERRDPKTVGTTSGREFLPRQVDVPLFARGAFRYRDVMERLYPEADWLGGRLTPLSGELRFLSWRAEPLRLTARIANDGPAPARVGVRQLDFPGWRAWLDGQPVAIEHAPYVPEQQAAPGFIVLDVPPGEHTVGLAFGPSPPRAIGGALTLLAVAGLALVLATRRRIAPLARGAALVAAVLVGALVWRGARPALAPFAHVPLPAPAQGPGVDGVWRAPDLEGNAAGWGLNPRTGLLVNLAEAVRRDRAAVNSPSGSERGPGALRGRPATGGGGRGRPPAGGLGDDPPAVAVPPPAVRGGPGRGPPCRPPDLAAGRPGARSGGLGCAQRGRGALPGGRRRAGLPGPAGPALDRLRAGPQPPGQDGGAPVGAGGGRPLRLGGADGAPDPAHGARGRT